MSTAIRRVRIMAGVLGLLSGAHVRLRLVRRLVRLRIVRRLGPPRVLQLVQPVVAGVVEEAAAVEGEV